ncbi:MAG: hypothetical protein PHT36_02055 [Patescibacteria group bacterium]|nr:hypothetical protein [Patescibacteria group bacterium]
MDCQVCQKKSAGIKINGKIFCPYCGEIIKDPTELLEESYEKKSKKEDGFDDVSSVPENQEPKAKRIDKEGKEIEKIKEDIKSSKTEREVIEKIEELSLKKKKELTKIKNKKIIKSNRNRIGMSVLPNEPDPIKVLELEPPTNLEIQKKIDLANQDHGQEKEKGKKNRNKKEADKEKISAKKELDILSEKTESKESDFLKNKLNLKKTKDKKMLPRKQGACQKKRRVLFIVLLFFVALVILGGGTVFYVNNFVINPSIVLERIEKKPKFDFKRPVFMPPGYEINHLSSSNDKTIEYVFQKFDKSNQIKIKETFLSDNGFEIYREIVAKKNVDYKLFSLDDDNEIWLLGKREAYFINKDILFEIVTTDQIPEEDLLKIAKDLIN